MGNTEKLQKQKNVRETGKLDYSKAEILCKNIEIPKSQFNAKWNKDKGYAVGIENIKLTKDYETLEEALNQIGYGVDKDKDDEEILVKVGETDYEMFVRIVKAILIIEDEKKNG